MGDGQVRFLAEARRELDDALGWYLERSQQAAEAFARETSRAITAIAMAPGVWPPFNAGTRRYVIQRFPYSVIYRKIESGIEVVAVAHHKRQPRYWLRRLRR